MAEMELFNGKNAVRTLASLSDLVCLHRKDNTDKFWSYKIKGGKHNELAFDPRTKTKVIIRLDCEPPRVPGIESIQNLLDKDVSTALQRVFSGGTHLARYKAQVRDEDALEALIRHLAGKHTPGKKSLPLHGPIACRECWETCESFAKEQVTADGRFRLVNDPGAWGSPDPSVLVLGISKGNTQAKEFEGGEFDQVPFKKCRPRLRDSIAAAGLIEVDDDIDSRMSAAETDFAFGSVVRCSVTGLKDGKWKAGTPEVIPAFSHSEASSWLDNCFRRHLAKLPDRLRVIALAGNDDRWIKTVRDKVQVLYPESFRFLNDVAYEAGGKLWVHIAHPSPGNGHFSSFVSGAESETQGRKRELAREVVQTVLKA